MAWKSGKLYTSVSLSIQICCYTYIYNLCVCTCVFFQLCLWVRRSGPATGVGPWALGGLNVQVPVMGVTRSRDIYCLGCCVRSAMRGMHTVYNVYISQYQTIIMISQRGLQDEASGALCGRAERVCLCWPVWPDLSICAICVFVCLLGMHAQPHCQLNLRSCGSLASIWLLDAFPHP